MLTPQDHSFYNDLARLNRAYSAALAKGLAPLGILPGYLSILHRLWKRDGLTQKELHATLDIEQATLSNTLKRMERDGLLTRERSPKDRRTTRIVLTQRGRESEQPVKTVLDDVHTGSIQGLTVNDRKYFYRIIKQMKDNLDASLDEGPLLLVDEVADDPS